MLNSKKKLSLQKETIVALRSSELNAIGGRSGIIKIRKAESNETIVSCQHPEIIIQISQVKIPVDLSYAQNR